ncbi:YceI family protein [uncultured Neptuniibacter sp.]|uniref:YceI family protein n=1 Tax=uncultured Neptuniibacter sp. TaxID=502143 RepID=UPI002603EE2E|nr:YceI family protein [uncultured Neptuniibacter sp.]
MAYIRTLSLLISTLLLYSCSALVTPDKTQQLVELKPGQYRIDPAHTHLLFKVDHLGLSTYVGRFNHLDASLNFSPSQISATTLEAWVDTASIDTNNSKMESMLRDEAWLNTQQYPRATFKTTQVIPQSGNHFIFEGDLTLKGITQPISLNGHFNGGATNLLTFTYTLGFTASGTIKRSDFNLDKYSGLVGDEVTLEIYAEFQKQ